MTNDKKDNNSIFKIAINLTVACVVSGLIIATVYFFTHDIALQKAEELKTMALESLITNVDEYTEIPDHNEWYTASTDGEIIGYIVPSESKGYGGSIKLLVAVSPAGTVMSYTIIDANETPGLGDKAEKSPFIDQFPGKTAEQLTVTKDANNSENILAISGATITSKAVTLAVKTAVDEVNEYLEGGE
ncbi:MAG TPA: FMN-binding protein [Clostridiales bacterium]|nr:FMN-binding protein [Clostridiales bacterium]